MTDLTRLWIAADAEQAGRSSAALASAGAVAVAREPGSAISLGSGWQAAFDALAMAHPGAQLVVALERERWPEVLQAALGLANDAISANAGAVDTEWKLCVDWPSGRSSNARPALVGLGLNWIPPWNGGMSARYPGGPGSAASGK